MSPLPQGQNSVKQDAEPQGQKPHRITRTTSQLYKFAEYISESLCERLKDVEDDRGHHRRAARAAAVAGF
jgi:hypothetical protein